VKCRRLRTGILIGSPVPGLCPTRPSHAIGSSA
jgi:hypothetical protein